MVIKSIIKKYSLFLKVGIFLLIFCSTDYIVFGATISDYVVLLNNSNKESLISYHGDDWSFKPIFHNLTDVQYLNFYDKDNNLLFKKLTGDLPSDEKLYPLKIVLETNDINSSVRLEISSLSNIDNGSGIDPGEGDSNNEDFEYNYFPVLDSIKLSFDSLLKKFDNLYFEVLKINDYLSNMDHLTNAIDNLSDSIDNMKNYAPISVASNGGELIQGIDVKSDLGSFNSLSSGFSIEYAPGVFIESFDLSAFTKELSLIRTLMSSIMWISLFIYLIRYFMPKFKV